MLFELLVVLVELTEFIRKNVSVGHEVEMLLAISFLHPDNVEAKSIFPCDLVALGEVVYLLVLVQSFIQVALA